MATRLQQIVSQVVAAGATVAIPHSLNVKGTPVIPDYISRSNAGFTGISANTTTVTVRNDTGVDATIQLRLRYYHTEDRVYGDAATLQMTPAPFWDGGASAITGSGAFVEFVYQPGGTATGPMVFASFPTLYAAMVAARVSAGGNIPIILGYDSSLGAVTVPAGTYSFVNVTEVGVSATGVPITVNYADGTVFTGQRRWRNLIVVNANTTTPPITDVVDGDQFFLDRTVLSTTTGVTVPMIRAGVASTFTLWVANGSAIGGGGPLGGTQTGRVIGHTGGGVKVCVVVLDETSQIAALSSIVLTAPATLTIQVPGGKQLPAITSSTMTTGTPNYNAPASILPIPYNAGAINSPVTMVHGSWARLSSAGGVTQPLPDISAAAASARGFGMISAVSNLTGGGQVTVSPGAGDTINGLSSSIVLPADASLFVVSDGVSNWTVISLTVDVPQVLRSIGYDTPAAAQPIANDAAIAVLCGYAWKTKIIGEAVTLTWRNTVAAADLTWGEVAVGAGAYVAGSATQGVTAVGFVDGSATYNVNTTNATETITLAGAILKGQAIWAIFAAANTTTPPEVMAGLVDVISSGGVVTLATAGWRPSLQLGVAANWAESAALAAPKAAMTF